MRHHRFINCWAIVCLALLVAGCGGSGSGPAMNPGQALHVAYVVNATDNTISSYALNPVNGQLVSLGQTQTGPGFHPISIALDPTAKHAYTANFVSGNVSTFAIDAQTGALSAVGAPVAGGLSPRSITVSPDGKFAFVANSASGDVSSFSIAPGSGALTLVNSFSTLGATPIFIAAAASGKFVYVANFTSSDISIFSEDANGGLTLVGSPVPSDLGPRGIAFDRTGKFMYVAASNATEASVFAVDTATGKLTPAATPFAAGDAQFAIASNPNGAFTYLTTGTSILSLRVDAASGALSTVGTPIPVNGDIPAAVAVDPSGNFAFVANFGEDGRDRHRSGDQPEHTKAIDLA